MKKFYSIICISVLLITNLYAQSGSGWEWASVSGTTASSPGINANDVTTDANGNVYAVGRYKSIGLTVGSFSLSTPTGSDIFIAKYNASGNIQWLKQHAPPTGYNEVSKVITTDADGNVYIGGTDDTPSLSGVAFLAKYDSDGNMLWNKYYSLYEVGGINIGSDGNPIIMESNQTAKNILKINKTDGSTIWTVQNTNAGSNAGTVYKDFIDQNGNIYYTCFAMSAATVSIAGESITTTGLASFIASIDNNGQKRWVQTINNIQVQLGYTIDETGKSYIIFTGGGGGTFQGISTASLANRYFELDNLGNVTKYAATSPYTASKAMFRVKGNNVYGFYMDQAGTAHGVVLGDYFYSLPATSTFALGLIAKYNLTNGQVVWANSFEINGSSSNSGSFNAIEISASGKIAVAGAYGTSVKFGSTSLSASGSLYATDFYVAQFNSNNIAPPAITNWTGAAADGNWNNVANWDNGIPDGSKKTSIPAGLTSYPTTIPANATGGKLEVAAGATIQLPLSFSAPGGIVNNGTIEINESTTGTFMGTFASNAKPTGNGKLVFKNDKTTIYLTQPLDQSVEINSNAAVSTYGGTINGDLILTKGILNFIVAVYPLMVNGNVTGGSASSYVAGALNRKVAANGNYAFPIGTSDRYAPVQLQLNNIVGPQTISASFSKNINGSAPNTTVGGQTVTSLLNAGIWTITPDAALTFGNYTVTLEGHGYTNGVADIAKYVVLKRSNSSGAWAFYGDNGTSTQSGGAVTATAGNITGFSDFAIGIASGEVPTVLPVKLIKFNVKAQINSVLLNWETASEQNNKGFEIYRRGEEGGKQKDEGFVKIGEVSATFDYQLSSINYTFTDKTPLSGNNYYKLIQVDNDGKTTELGIRTINFGLPTSNIRIFPNPATSYFSLAGNKLAISKVTLTDVSGRIVLTVVNPTEKMGLPNLANGIYIVNISYLDGTSSKHKLRITQ